MSSSLTIDSFEIETDPLPGYCGWRPMPSHVSVHVGGLPRLENGFHLYGSPGGKRVGLMVTKGRPAWVCAQRHCGDVSTYATLVVNGIPVTNPRSGWWGRVKVKW